MLNVAMDEASSGIQWLCIIIFFTIVLVVVAKICGANAREEKDARN
jgi:hypothetical protein